MLAGSSPRRPRRAPIGAAAALVAALACASLGCALPPARAAVQQPTPYRNLRIADGDLDREPQTVSAEDALRDLDDARYAFEQAYAGLDGRARVPSPAAIARAEGVLRGRAAWRPDDFARLLRDLFAAPDGHLAFGHGGRSPLRLTAVPPRSPSLLARSAAAEVASFSLLSSSSEVAPPSILSPPAEHALRSSATWWLESSATWWLDPPHPPDRRPPVELTRGRDGVPVLAIRTFDSAAAAALATLPALADELRRAPAFVVDLRGNTGGNYLFAERFALALTDAPLRRLDEREVLSVAAAEGRANSVRRRLARGDVPSEALPRFHDQLATLERLAEALRLGPHTVAPRIDLTTRGAVIRGRAAGPLRGRAVFLVDGGCASACEMLLALVRQIPGVVVAGQNTRGGMSVGEIAYFQLPRSRVALWLGTRAFRDPLGDFVETRGFEPDVRLDGPDPVGAAVALARR